MAGAKWFIGFPVFIMLCVAWFSALFYTCVSPSCTSLQPVFLQESKTPLGMLLKGDVIGAIWGAITGAFTTLGNLVGAILSLNSNNVAAVINASLAGFAAVGLFLLGLLGGQIIGTEGQRTAMALSIGLLLWSFISGYSTLLYSIPYDIGQILWFAFTVMYAYGVYDLSRSHF